RHSGGFGELVEFKQNRQDGSQQVGIVRVGQEGDDTAQVKAHLLTQVLIVNVLVQQIELFNFNQQITRFSFGIVAHVVGNNLLNQLHEVVSVLAGGLNVGLKFRGDFTGNVANIFVPPGADRLK